MTRRSSAWYRSIAAQVWFMVVVCAAVVVALVVVNTRAELRDQRSAVDETLQRQGSALAESIAEAAAPGGATEQTLASIAEQPAIASAGQGCPAALATLQRAVETGYLAVVDRSGVVRCAAAPDVVRVGAALFADIPAVRRMAGAGRAGTDGPFVLPGFDEPIVVTGVPVRGEPGLLMVFLSDSQSYFAPVEQDTAGTTSAVVDMRTGLVAMHYPKRAGAVGRSVRGTPLAGALESTRRLTTVVGLDGVTGLYRATRIGDTPYQLLIGVSQEESYADVRDSLMRNALIGLALILAMMGLGLLLQRRVARPARALRGAIVALARDPEAAEAPTDGPTELSEVAEAFNTTTQARRRADGLSRAILQHASDLLFVVDGEGRVSFAAPVARSVLGLEEGDAVGALADQLHPDHRERVLRRLAEWVATGQGDLLLECQVYDVEGRSRFVEARVQDLRDDRYVQGLVVTAHDITERTAFEQHLAHQARHDPLTGLPNRAAVLEHLAARLDDAAATPIRVLFVDLDRFKLVNDSHGHAIGDKVLIALGRKLREVCGPEALVGRFGGDEFVVVTSDQAADTLAALLRSTLEEPLAIGRRELFITGSIGIATATPGDRPEVVLRNADTAMYRAKAQGRNRSAVFDEAMRQEAQRLLRTESDLHRALERDQLVVHFQPLVSVADQRVSGVEALVRWEHPYHGLVPPADFIPVAEETGLVVPIGAWVLEATCTWAEATGRRLGVPLGTSVNVSPRQLAQADVLEMVDAALLASGLRPELLTLEVTESVLVQDAEAARRVLQALHERGVRVSIDDFGTGWSSLTYLQQFPVDEIKLDRSFVSKVDQDPASRTIVGALIGMAHAMGLSVVAEGVERPEQLAFLTAQGADLAQGWLFAPALDAQDLGQLLGVWERQRVLA